MANGHSDKWAQAAAPEEESQEQLDKRCSEIMNKSKIVLLCVACWSLALTHTA